MRTKRIRYTILFIVILLLVIYQILLSFNILPYIFTGQDIIVILLLFIAVFLLLISTSLVELSRRGAIEIESLVLEASPQEIDISPIAEKDINLFIGIQNYFKDSESDREALKRLLVASAKMTGSNRASLLLHNRKTDDLFIYKTMGWDRDEIKMLKDIRIKPGEGITGRVFIDEKPLIVNNIEKGTDFEPKDKYRSKAFVSTPLFTDDAVIGVLNITEKEKGKYSQKELDILNFMINEVSTRIRFPL